MADDTVTDTIECGDSVTGSTTSSGDINYYTFDPSSFTTSGNIDFTVSTCASTTDMYDTVAYLYAANDCGGTALAYNDDAGSTSCSYSSLDSIFSYTTNVDTSYCIGIGGYDSYYGTYGLEVSCSLAPTLYPTSPPPTPAPTSPPTPAPTSPAAETLANGEATSCASAGLPLSATITDSLGWVDFLGANYDHGDNEWTWSNPGICAELGADFSITNQVSMLSTGTKVRANSYVSAPRPPRPHL